MSFARKVQRNKLRKIVSNKNLQSAWKFMMDRKRAREDEAN